MRITRLIPSGAWLPLTALLGLVLASLLVLESSPQAAELALGQGDAAHRLAARQDLVLTKSADPGQVAAGGLVTYSVVLSNSGATTATVTTIVDTLDPGLTFAGMLAGSDVPAAPISAANTLTWTGPLTVAPLSALTLLYQAQAPAGPDPLHLCNQVVVSTTTSGLAPAEACIDVDEVLDLAYLPVMYQNLTWAHLSVAKSVSPGAIVAGTDSEVVYTVAVTNVGDLPAHLTAVTDTLPAGLTFLGMGPGSDIATSPTGTAGTIAWTGSWAMPPGHRLDVVYRVRANTAAGQVANSVVVAAQDATVDREPAVASLSVEQPVAGLAASNDGPTYQGQPTTLNASVSAGSNVAYTWAFGDGTTGSGGSTTHVYPATGTYTATVTAHNGVSQQTASTVVTINPAVLFEENFDDPGARLSRWTRFLNYWRLEEDQWVWEEDDGVGGSGAATQDCWLGGKKVAEDALLMYLGPGATSWTDYRVETRLLLRGGVTEQDGDLVVTEVGGYPIGLWVRGQYQDVGDTDTAGWVTGYYIIVGGKPTNDTMFVRLSQLQTLTDCWDNACNNPQNLYDFNNPHQLHEVILQRTFARKQWYTLAVEVRGSNIKIFWENQLVMDYTDAKEPFLTGTIGLKTYKSKTASFDDVRVTPLD